LYSRDYPEEEELQMLRRQEEEEELQMLRREVQGGAGAGLVAGIQTQTITEGAARAMSTVELRQTRERLTTRFFTDPSAERTTPVPSANLQVVEAELARREGALAAMTTEELSRQCNRELSRLQRWMLSPGGLALQTLRAYDGAVGNFVDFAGVSSSGGVQFSDVFGIVLAFVPAVGPVARWVGQEAIRAATVAAAQAAAGAAVQRGTSMATEAGTATEQGARASFAAQVRAESAALADALARNVDGALSIYERAVDAAQGANDADWLRRLLVALQHENDQVRAVPVARYAELARQFEIELYRRHYRNRAYIHVIEHNVWGVTSREVRGIPDAVQSALMGRLRAADSMLSLARSWGLSESVTRTSGGRF
jgi:hypothetical protein